MKLKVDSKSESGFTLIEMLVVIAIIALLAALLVPGVTRAMRRAVLMTCQGNLQQMGHAIELYVDAHDSHYPPYPYTEGLSAAQSGIISSNKSSLRYYLASYLGTKDIKKSHDPTFTCPATAKLPPNQLNNIQYVINHAATIDGSVVDVWIHNTGKSGTPSKRLSAPSSQWMISDADQTHPYVGSGWSNYDKFAPYPGHVDRWNNLYFDMHVGLRFP